MKIHLVDKKGTSTLYEDIKTCHVLTDAQDTVVSALEHECYVQVRSPELQAITASKTLP